MAAGPLMQDDRCIVVNSLMADHSMIRRVGVTQHHEGLTPFAARRPGFAPVQAEVFQIHQAHQVSGQSGHAFGRFGPLQAFGQLS